MALVLVLLDVFFLFYILIFAPFGLVSGVPAEPADRPGPTDVDDGVVLFD